MKKIFHLLAGVWILFLGSAARAEVGLTNHLGADLKGHSIEFVDEHNRTTPLDQYFHTGRPVIMALVYFGCPGICTVLLSELVSTLKQISILPGRAFDVVVVSIDPDEKPPMALAKKASYLKAYGGSETSAGWHFLTGTTQNIAALSERLGFHFERDPGSGAFNHPSVLFFLTPDGVLSQSLSGIKFSKKLVRLCLLDAAGGHVGTFLDRVRSLCTNYLPHVGVLNSPERWFTVLAILMFGVFALALVGLRSLRVRQLAAKTLNAR